MTWHEMKWHHMKWHYVKWRDVIRNHKMWNDAMRNDMIRNDRIWHDRIWHDRIWHDMIWHDMMIRHDMKWYGKKWYDAKWHNMRLSNCQEEEKKPFLRPLAMLAVKNWELIIKSMSFKGNVYSCYKLVDATYQEIWCNFLPAPPSHYCLHSHQQHYNHIVGFFRYKLTCATHTQSFFYKIVLKKILL